MEDYQVKIPKQLKLCYFVSRMDLPGGIERVISLKANYFAELFDYDVTIVSFKQTNAISYYGLGEKVRFIQAQIPFVETKKLYKKGHYAKRNKAIIREWLTEFLVSEKFDVTISVEFSPSFLHLPYIGDQSVKIAELHNSFRGLVVDFRQATLVQKLFFLNRYLKWFKAANKYNRFVVLTEKDNLRWKNFLTNTAVIPNPCPFEVHNLGNREFHTCIAVGRLHYQKGFDILIEMWSEVTKAFPEWTLEIYGEGPEKDKLQRQINHLKLNKQIKLMGAHSNIQEIMNRAALMLFSSRYEGFPMTLLEATACGLPVISFDCECGPSDIIVHERSGILVKTFDKQKFIKEVLHVLNNHERLLLLSSGAIKQAAFFRPEIVLDKWLPLFNRNG